MGSLMLDDMDDTTWLVDVSTKKIRIAEVIRERDTVFIRYTDDKRKFRRNEFSVCRSYRTEKWAFPVNVVNWTWQEDFLNALVRLKIVTPAYAANIISLSKKKQAKVAASYDRERLQELAKIYGFEITAKQLKAMEDI